MIFFAIHNDQRVTTTAPFWQTAGVLFTLIKLIIVEQKTLKQGNKEEGKSMK